MWDSHLPEPLVPTAGELPIYDSEDVRQLLPVDYRQGESPILDALIEALTQMAIAWQDAGTAAMAQSDMATATEHFLDGLGADRKIYRAENEEQEPFRARAVAVPDTVDRIAILDAVNAILLPYTPIEAHIFDSNLDRWYATDGTAVFHSFIGASPSYTDRIYDDRPGSSPGGAYAFSGHIGRAFLLRVPDISPIESVHAFVGDESLPYKLAHRLFLGNGSQSNVAGYVSKGNSTALAVYQSIADKVNALCGHSIRWALIVDPNLTS